MSTDSCTLYCRSGSAKYDPKTLQDLGCSRVDTPSGIVISCPISCSTMMRAVRAQGPAVKVADPIAIAAYTHHGSDFLGYVSYNENYQRDTHVVYNSTNAFEIKADDTDIFRLTRNAEPNGIVHAPQPMVMPDVFRIDADESAGLNGRPIPFDGTVKYGFPYKLFTTWKFLPAPNTLLSRRQERNRMLPTTASVMCLYGGRNPNREAVTKVDCAYDNSRWVFIPADGATEEGETLCKDDLFYIAEYPNIGKSQFLKWRPEVSNFDLVQKSEASVFSFPSSPVENGGHHSSCQYVSGNLVSAANVASLNDGEEITINIQRGGDVSVANKNQDFGWQEFPAASPSGRKPTPLPAPPRPVDKKGGNWLIMIIAGVLGVLAIMYALRLRSKAGCASDVKVPSAAVLASIPPATTVRIVP